jgi:hypothetical protein
MTEGGKFSRVVGESFVRIGFSLTARVVESHYVGIISKQRGPQIMQEIQLLTREDIVEIVERELRGQFQALRDEMLGAFKGSVVDAVKGNLHEIVETIMGQELNTFRQEVLDALEQAVRQVTAERNLTEGDSEDDYRQ